MNDMNAHEQNFRNRRRGFTIVEATLSTLIMGITLAAALQTAATSSVTQYKASERATSQFLANSFLNDILSLSYEETGVALFGVEAGETSLSKVNYDDVDDFHGWSESPPQDRTGVVIAGMTGWRRTVAVQWVTPANTNVVSASETGLKKITVTILHNSTVVATRSALKAKVA
jgi:type II secretory pathway pseudopilin PulG